MVLPWQLLATAEAPDGQALTLSRRGHEYLIRVGGWDLMSSRDDTSARALTEIGCRGLESRAGVHVLIGGLGMGFSVAPAVERLARDATIDVAELVPAVVEWNREVLAELAGRVLADPRVHVHVGDVGALIRTAHARWDAILLDVDNGPDALAHAGNAALYGSKGLHAAHRALRPGGVLAVWSYSDAGGFAKQLEQAGFSASIEPVANHGRDRGRTHAIWIGRRR